MDFHYYTGSTKIIQFVGFQQLKLAAIKISMHKAAIIIAISSQLYSYCQNLTSVHQIQKEVIKLTKVTTPINRKGLEENFKTII